MSVAIKLPLNNVAVVAEYFHESFIVAFPHGRGALSVGQVTNRDVSNHIDLCAHRTGSAFFRREKKLIGGKF